MANLLSDYKNWEKKQKMLSYKSTASYGSYLSISHNNLLGLSPHDPLYDYMKTIGDLYDCNVTDILYAVSILNKVIDAINKLPSVPKQLSDQRSALKRLRIFLHTNYDDVRDLCVTPLDKVRNRINKSDIDKIDGNRVLIKNLGIDGFIQNAIASSYFFSKDLVVERCRYIKEHLGKNPLPGRKTTKEDRILVYVGANNVVYYMINHASVPVIEDPDGNFYVRRLINKKTGYTISQGADSIFQNYKISHLWGKAYDPRFFTNLWNIILVPAWANDLLDKNANDPQSLEYRIKLAYKKICNKLYGLDSREFLACWDEVSKRMGDDSGFPDQKDLGSGKKPYTFYVNVIYPVQKGYKLGRIMREEVTILL